MYSSVFTVKYTFKQEIAQNEYHMSNLYVCALAASPGISDGVECSWAVNAFHNKYCEIKDYNVD